MLPADALRDDPLAPGYTMSDRVLGRCQGRDEALRTAQQYIQQVSSMNYNTTAPVVTKNGICGTVAARGCGKSFILDVLAEKCSDPYFVGKDLARRLVPIIATFNGQQNADHLEYKHGDAARTVRGRLRARLVHAAFCKPSVLPFQPFMVRVKGFRWGDMPDSTVGKLLIQQFQRLGVHQPVLLVLVDEVVRSLLPEAVMRSLMTLLDECAAKCRVVATTFDVPSVLRALTTDSVGQDATPADVAATGSARPIEWLWLPPLPVSGLRRVVVKPPNMPDCEFEYLLAMTGGHPRSAAFVAESLSQYPDRKLIDRIRGLATQLVKCGLAGGRRVPTPVVMDLLARTLTNTKLHPEETLFGMSFRQLLIATAVINSPYDGGGSVEAFVPQMSPLVLLEWAQHIEGSEEEHAVKATTLNALQCGTVMQGEVFEEFVACLQALRCWASRHLGSTSDGRGRRSSDGGRSRAGGSTCTGSPVTSTLQEWFGAAAVVKGGDLTIQVPDPQLAGDRVSRLTESLDRSTTPLQVGTCYLARACNPGLDMVQPVLTKEGTPVLLVFQDKWSEPRDGGKTATPLTVTAVRDAVVNTQKQIEDSKVQINGKAIDPETSVFVVVAHRHTVKGFANKLFAGPPRKGAAQRTQDAFAKFIDTRMKALVVLDRAGTVAFSGPTFSNLAAFQMKYADVNFSSVGAGDDSAATAGGGASGGGGGGAAGAASSGGGRGPADGDRGVSATVAANAPNADSSSDSDGDGPPATKRLRNAGPNSDGGGDGVAAAAMSSP